MFSCWEMRLFSGGTSVIAQVRFLAEAVQGMAAQLQFSYFVVIPIPSNESRQSVFDRRSRHKSEVSAACFDVGVSFRYIAHLQRLKAHLGFHAERRFENRNEIRQLFRAIVAEIVNGVRRAAGARPAEGGNDSPHDIVDIGKVAPPLASVEYGDRFTGKNRTRKNKRSHVRSSPRAINGEKPQARARNSVKMRVGVADQFVGALRRRIKRVRLFHAIIDTERQLFVASVYRRRACIDKMT